MSNSSEDAVGGVSPAVSPAVVALRNMLVSGEAFRGAVATRFRVGVRETEAISHLRANGPMSPAELGEQLRLTTATVTDLLDRLERAELAERQPHPSDRRRALVHLTPRAHELSSTVAGWLDACFDGIDRRAAAEMLESLAAAVARTAADVTPADRRTPRQRR